MNTTDRTRDLFLWTMIAMFGFTGVVGSVSFLLGEFNDTMGRTLVTTLTVGFASLLGLICSRRVSAGGAQSVFGHIGIVTAILSALLWTTVIWGMVDFDEAFGKAIAVTSVVSFAMAHLLIVWRDGGSRVAHTVTSVTMVLILIVTVMLVGGCVAEFDVPDAYWRFLGFFGVLDVVGTIVSPMLFRLESGRVAAVRSRA